MKENTYRHFDAEKVLIPVTERGGGVDDGTQVVVGPDGSIAFVGSRDDAQAFLRTRESEGAQIQVERGGVLLPGMNDTHFHPGIWGMLNILKTRDVSNADSLNAFARMVREANQNPGLRNGEPLTILNYDSGRIGTVVTDINLDEVVADRPAFLLDRSFHGGTANIRGRALLKEYIDRHYPGETFPGKFTDKEITETYTLLALELVESFQSVDQVKDAMESEIDGYLAGGVTGMHELAVGSWHEMMSYMLLHQEWSQKHPDVQFPVRRIYPVERILGRLEREASQLVASGLLTEDLKGILGVKLIADGAFGSETALLNQPYYAHRGHHDGCKCGVAVTEIGAARKAMERLLHLGLNKVATHAIGDKAIERAIEFAQTWQRMAESRGIQPDFRFDHFELPLGSSVEEAAKLGVIVSSQPNFALEDYHYEDRLGDRVRMLCPHADLATNGVPMMIGTDGMPKSMLYAIYSAVHHPNPAQRLDLISAMTAAAATASTYEGGLGGVLKVGAKTDIVVATPKILEELANGELAGKYVEEAVKPPAERKHVPVRDMIGRLEGEIRKVFRGAELVYQNQLADTGK